MVKNNLTGEEVEISEEDYQLIKRIIKKKFPVGYDPYPVNIFDIDGNPK